MLRQQLQQIGFSSVIQATVSVIKRTSLKLEPPRCCFLHVTPWMSFLCLRGSIVVTDCILFAVFYNLLLVL